MPLSQLIYMSQFADETDDDDITSILATARERNRELHVTGLLLVSKPHFIQILEGDSHVVQDLFDMISGDSRHLDVRSLAFDYVTDRTFPSWQMGKLDVQRDSALRADELEAFADALQKEQHPRHSQSRSLLIMKEFRRRLLESTEQSSRSEPVTETKPNEEVQELKKVLLVARDAMLQSALGKFFATSPFKMDSVGDAEQAFDAMAQKPPHAVLVDADLHPMSCVEFTEQVAKRFPSIPVIVLAGVKEEDDARRCFQVGATDFIRKDDLRAELFDVLTRVIRGAKTDGADLVEIKISESDRSRGKDVLAGANGIERDYYILSGTTSGKSAGQSMGRGNAVKDEYVVRPWRKKAAEEDAMKGDPSSLSREKIMILKRQFSRLRHWQSLGEGTSIKANQEQTYAASTIVHLAPLDHDDAMIVSRRQSLFCRELTANGSTLINNRVIPNGRFVLHLPHGLVGESLTVLARVVSQEPTFMGMYEIKMEFEKRVRIGEYLRSKLCGESSR